jgi:hypothetical protein
VVVKVLNDILDGIVYQQKMGERNEVIQ